MIKIDSLDHNGKGIAKINNKIIFVENALPEEIVNIDIIEEKKNYINAKVSNYITESKERIKVSCPYYNLCGGCDIMHMNYKYQLFFKEEKIKNIINKYVDNNIKINKIIKSDITSYYRNKITLKVENSKIGFYYKNSHNLIEIDECILADKKINNAIKYIKELDLKYITEITLRVANNKLMIIITSQKKDIDCKKILDIADSIYIKYKKKYYLLNKDKYIYENIGKYKYSILPDAFFQININVCAKLYNYINESIGKGNNVLDLYCGTGSIGIFVSEENNVVGIEINEQAIENAIKNKDINQLNNINFILGDSNKKIKNIDFKPNVIIIDPPRSGLNKDIIAKLLSMKSEKIIYVSCDPMTLARDLNELKKEYNVLNITPFDMFPNTKHVETVCVLKRK